MSLPPTPTRLELLKRFWRPYLALLRFLNPYRTRWIWGLIFGGLFGVVNGSLPAVIHQVGSIVFEKKIENPHLRAWIIPDGEHLPAWVLIAGCLAIPAVMMARSVLAWLNSYCAEWVSQRVLMDLRSTLLRAVMRQSMEYFNRTRAGETTQKIMMATQEAQGVIMTMNTDLVRQPISLLVGLSALFMIDWLFMVGALVLFPICLIPARYLGKRIRFYATRQQAGQGDMMVLINEILAGIKVVKGFSRSEHEARRFESACSHQFRQVIKMRSAMESHGPIVEAIAALGVGLAFIYVSFWNMKGVSLFALCAGIFLMYQPVKTLTRLHLFLQRSIGATNAIFDLLNAKPAVEDKPGALFLKRSRGHFAFENVSFAYRDDIPALRGITVSFDPGRRYALVGPSGAGKSTMLSLILRFYDPTAGHITLDGYDLRDLAQDSLRDQIALVSQDVFLFHDTIHANIAYGRVGASPAEVEAAARLAHAHDFIVAQVNGYDTVIGDKGCMLSGGQQQRVAIARALLKDAPVLLLDEATSALDSDSERQIQAALETLSEGRTVIAIAHRLSTIIGADLILVMEAGRIIARGTHAELLDSSPQYRRLYELQFGSPTSPAAPTTISA